MSSFLIFMIFILFFVIVVFTKTVKTVEQGEEWVIERLGKFKCVLLPGLRFVVPFIDKVAYKVPTKDLILNVEKQEVITKDNAVIGIDAIAYVKVTDPAKAVYGVQDFFEAIRLLIMTTLRSIVGEWIWMRRLPVVTKSRHVFVILSVMSR